MSVPAVAEPSRPSRRRFRAGRLLVLFVSGISLSLALAEAAVRVFDPIGISYFRHMSDFQREGLRTSDVPGLFYENKPGVDLDVGVPVRINSLGLRGGEIARPKPAGTWRVVVLGDSIAFGWGVPEEETFEALLASALAKKRGTPVEVLNAGVIMYNTVQERVLFDARDSKLEPDLVVLVYCHNDVLLAHTSPLPSQSEGARPAELDGLVSSLDWWLLTNSWRFAISDLLRQTTLERLMREMAKRGGEDAESVRRREIVQRYVQSAASKIDAEASWSSLGAIAAKCKEMGVPMVVVPFGAPAELPGVCAKFGIAYAAEADGINSDPDLRLSPVDAHPNAEGHRRMAERILHALDRVVR
jgi:lysophospholipase L1-like esterase